jgi:prophage antirepressor-like protein
MIVVSEPGVFRLIFTSRKPEAERFKRWLAHDVLPALRRNGSYTIPGREGSRPGAN